MRATRSRSPLGRFFGWLKASLTEHLGIKALCLVCALALVGYQRSLEDTRTRTVAFQLDFQLPPESANRELMTPLPPDIKLTLEGSTRQLDQLVSEVNSHAVDLRSGTQEQLVFRPQDFDIPVGVKVRFIEPARIALEWQDIITREVPVQSSVTGRVAEGYEVASLSVEPSTVQLRGPANLVQVTQFVRVAPFDVTGLSEGSFRRLLALDPPPDRTSYVGVSNVAVKVDIRRRLVSQVFTQVPVEVVGIPGARTTPAEVVVTVIGPPEVVRGINADLIVPRADVSEVEANQHGSKMVEVVVELSRAKAEIQPPTVKVSW